MTPPSSVTDRVPAMQTDVRFSTAFPYLSDEEKAVINAYTDKQYLNLNAFLRGKRFDAGHETALQTISDLLSVTLVKINPPYNPGYAYRGCYVSDEELAQLKEAFENGTVVEHVYFTSSSKVAGLAFNGSTKNAMKTIKSKQGKWVEEISSYPEEQEILFDKKSFFKVTYINETTAKIFVHLEEV